MALDFAPYKLLAPATQRSAYKGLARILWNTQLSLGVGKAVDSQDKSLNIGYGISSILWRRDQSDPVLNDTYQRCLTERLRVLNDPNAPTALGSSTGKDDALAKCYADFSSQAWNGTGLTVGFAGSHVSGSGKWSDSTAGSTGAWVTLSYGFEDFPGSTLRRNGEFVLTWRRLGDEHVVDSGSTDGFYNRDSDSSSAVLRYKQDDHRNWYLEYSYQRFQSDFKGDETSRRLAVGFEWKVGDSTWFTVGLGGEGGRSGDTNNNFVLTGLKFGSSDRPVFVKP